MDNIRYILVYIDKYIGEIIVELSTTELNEALTVSHQWETINGAEYIYRVYSGSMCHVVRGRASEKECEVGWGGVPGFSKIRALVSKRYKKEDIKYVA